MGQLIKILKEIEIKPFPFWKKIKVGDKIGDDFITFTITKIVPCYFIPYKINKQPVPISEANCIRFELDDGSNMFYYFKPRDEEEKKKNELLKLSWEYCQNNK